MNDLPESDPVSNEMNSSDEQIVNGQATQPQLTQMELVLITSTDNDAEEIKVEKEKNFECHQCDKKFKKRGFFVRHNRIIHGIEISVLKNEEVTKAQHDQLEIGAEVEISTNLKTPTEIAPSNSFDANPIEISNNVIKDIINVSPEGDPDNNKIISNDEQATQTQSEQMDFGTDVEISTDLDTGENKAQEPKCFKCEICDKKFMKKGFLIRHIRSIHRNEIKNSQPEKKINVLCHNEKVLPEVEENYKTSAGGKMLNVIFVNDAEEIKEFKELVKSIVFQCTLCSKSFKGKVLKSIQIEKL